MRNFGVHSEVGKLRTVMVCRPGLAHQRLTPGNCHDLLFDDVIWVHEAQKDHYDFALKMQERGVEVLELHDMLAQALEVPEGRSFVLDRRVTANAFGPLTADMLRPWLDEMPAKQLAAHLIGGIAVSDLPEAPGKNFLAENFGESEFVMPPIPNTLFQRDPSCWIYNGVTVNPMFWPARRRESLNMLTIYRYHPMFQDAGFQFWYPEQDWDGGFNIQDFGRASMEGGDVQPIGNGTVAIGMSERTQGRMIEMVAKKLFENGGAERVITAVMTKDRAHMHLDTVFTLLDRDIATAFPKVVNNIRAISLRPGKTPGDFHVTEEKSFVDAVADALHIKKLTIVETGGDEYQAQREQWDDANNTVALEPGVVVSYERNTFTIG